VGHKPFVEVLVKFFQKLAGVGGAHKNSVFFLIAFSFALLLSKEKARKSF